MLRMLGGLRRFLRDEEGVITVEALFAIPVLVWAQLACLVFFEAFRAESVSVKAAYAIGDALSREKGYITPAYMESLDKLHDFLVTEDRTRRLRVTVFRYRAGTGGAHEVRWSQTRGTGVAPLDDAALTALGGQLPVMADNDLAVMVETWVDHEPPFNILEPFTYADLVVTRLRFAPKLCWNSRDDGDASTETC